MSIWGKVGSAASAYWRNLNIAQAGRVVRFAGKSTKAGWRSASSGLGGQISNAGRAGGTSLGKGMANWAWRGKTTAQRATRLGTVGAAGLGVEVSREEAGRTRGVRVPSQ